MSKACSRTGWLTVAIAGAVLLSAGWLMAAPPQWNQFRGPNNGCGIWHARGVPVRFGEGSPEIRWKVPIRGKAWSSPVVWDEQIWFTTAPEDGHELFAICLDARTGEVLHDIKVFDVAEPQFCHPANSYASPTPFVEEGRVYVHFGRYGTACLDTRTGKKVWERRDILCDHWRGPGSSPVVDGELLFAHFDGYDKQFVIALDKHTGRTVWRRDRNIDYGTTNGDRKKAYGTPSVITVNGRKQLISPAAVATIAYDAATGEEIWKVYHGGMNACARVVSGHGLVYICAGDSDTKLVAVRPTGRGDVTRTHIVWSSGKSVPRRPSPLLIGDWLFLVSDEGVASCRDARTGEILWIHRLGGRYWASPVAVDGKIYFFSQDGKIPVVAVDDEFRLLAENRLDDGFNATAAFVGNRMILRTYRHVYCIAAAEGSR